MSTSLMLTALALGLAGTPHCATMCGAACAGLTGAGSAKGRGGEPATTPPAPGVGRVIPMVAAGGVMSAVAGRPMLAFQAGRIAGYATAGALAAVATQGLGWLSTQGAALRPLWTLFHLLVLAWGLSLLVLARQPAWAQQAGLRLWAQVGPWVRRTGGLFTAGALWVFMPCGLLWSALLVAGLTGGPVQGALAMGLFAAASGLGLVAVPGLLARLRGTGGDWPTRLAGGLLAATAVAALWMDLGQRIADWCA